MTSIKPEASGIAIGNGFLPLAKAIRRQPEAGLTKFLTKKTRRFLNKIAIYG
ncbi:MAG: hypothetical protein AAB401_19705 [Acidobacteriota bacterium]